MKTTQKEAVTDELLAIFDELSTENKKKVIAKAKEILQENEEEGTK